MNRKHHQLIIAQAAAMTTSSIIHDLLRANPEQAAFGAYAPDTVAFWSDHIANVNPYDPTDTTECKAVDFIVGVTDVLATLILPFGHDPADAAFTLGCLSHVAADVNQPYHCGGRHGDDHEEHREFERKMQDWVLAKSGTPSWKVVTLPLLLRRYFETVTLPRSYRSYRELLGNREAWEPAFTEIHARAVHDVLVVFGVVEREIARRKNVAARVAEMIEDVEPADAALKK